MVTDISIANSESANKERRLYLYKVFQLRFLYKLLKNTLYVFFNFTKIYLQANFYFITIKEFQS